MIKIDTTDKRLNDKSNRYSLSSDDRILHNKFVDFGLNAKEWTKKCVLLLPQIAKKRIWEKKGFSSIYEYAAKLAGMSHAKVDEALWILRKIEDKPDLQKIVEIKGIQSVKPIIAIANVQNAKFWAEKAKDMSRDTLRIYVKELKEQSLRNNIEKSNFQIDINEAVLQNGLVVSKYNDDFRAGPKVSPSLFHQQAVLNKEIITMELDKKLADKLKKLKGNGEWNNLLQQLIDIREKMIESEKQEIIEKQKIKDNKRTIVSKGKLMSAQSKAKGISRHIPNAIKKHVLAKINGSCAFPGCVKPAEILHHTKRFALASRVDVKAHADDGNAFVHHPDFIAPLCKAHERLAHLGLIENEDMPPDKWKIREKPDAEYENSAKFEIDRIVNSYRLFINPDST